MHSTDICIVSGGDEVRNRSYVNHTVYARERSFTHHLGIGLGRGITSPYYFKFEVIAEMLPRFAWTVWLDDDVYVTDMVNPVLEGLIAQAEADGGFLVLAEGPRETDGTWTRINTGVMAFRNDPRSVELLDDARAIPLASIEAEWDEDEHGLFTHGDQDAIWWALRTKPHLMAGTTIVGHRSLNSREHYFESALTDAFSVHFCGPGDKDLKTARFGRRFGLGQELVASELLDAWSVRRRQTMSSTEIAARDARWRARQFAKRVRRKIDYVRETGRWK